VTIASGCAGARASEHAQSRPAPTAAERRACTPLTSRERVSRAEAEPPKSAYLREEDIVFRPRAGAATVRLVERGRSKAWFGRQVIVLTPCARGTVRSEPSAREVAARVGFAPRGAFLVGLRDGAVSLVLKTSRTPSGRDRELPTFCGLPGGRAYRAADASTIACTSGFFPRFQMNPSST
jgi:hypothetical protein